MRTLKLAGGGGSLTITSGDDPEPLYWGVSLVSGGLHANTDTDLDAIRHHVAPIAASAQVAVEAGQLDRLARDADRLPPLTSYDVRP